MASHRRASHPRSLLSALLVRTSIVAFALSVFGCAELDPGPSPPELFAELERLEVLSGELTDASIERVARRIDATDAAYAVFRSHFVAATEGLTARDDDTVDWSEETSGWFTIYRPCELGGEFELTGRFVGTELERTLWGELRGCAFGGSRGDVTVDAEYLVSLAEPAELERAPDAYAEIALTGVVAAAVRDEPLRVVYATRLTEEHRFSAAIRGTGGDVLYERADATPTIWIEDVADLWTCDLDRRQCTADSLKELEW